MHALKVFADGVAPGDALFVGGIFTTAGGSSIRIARWGSRCGCELESYCTAGTTANGCQAQVGGLGLPSRSAPDGFRVTVYDVEGQKQGIVFWGPKPNAVSWGQGSSVVCIKPPTTRTGTLSSAGTAGLCDGTLTLDFNGWMAANPQKAPPAGSTAHVQGWFRDPPSPKGTSLSNGLRFFVCP